MANKKTSPSRNTVVTARHKGAKPVAGKAGSAKLNSKRHGGAVPGGPQKATGKAAGGSASKKANNNVQPPKVVEQPVPVVERVKVEHQMSGFEKKQWERLMALRDAMLDSMSEVARDSLRSRAEGNEASAFGMHQADAGSDAYDRDFALSLLSQEQDALYEIDEALKRIEMGTYGVCQVSGKKIPHERLEAIPFARLTVECQSEIERQRRMSARARAPVHSLFAPAEEEGSPEEAEEETITERRE